MGVAHSPNTDSCINAVCKFIARQGTIGKFTYLANGINIVKTEREMREEIGRWNEVCFHKIFHQIEITWKFNLPGRSHFGGIRERLGRSLKKILYPLLQEQMV